MSAGYIAKMIFTSSVLEKRLLTSVFSGGRTAELCTAIVGLVAIKSPVLPLKYLKQTLVWPEKNCKNCLSIFFPTCALPLAQVIGWPKGGN